MAVLCKFCVLNSSWRLLHAGELCVMFRQDVLPYCRRLLPIIIGHILDTSSVKKQEIAVKTLGIVPFMASIILPPCNLCSHLFLILFCVLFQANSCPPRVWW